MYKPLYPWQLKDYSTDQMIRVKIICFIIRQSELLFYMDFLFFFFFFYLWHHTTYIHIIIMAFFCFLLTQITNEDQRDKDDQSERLKPICSHRTERACNTVINSLIKNNKQKEKIGSSSEQSLNDGLLYMLLFPTTFFGM